MKRNTCLALAFDTRTSYSASTRASPLRLSASEQFAQRPSMEVGLRHLIVIALATLLSPAVLAQRQISPPPFHIPSTPPLPPAVQASGPLVRLGEEDRCVFHGDADRFDPRWSSMVMYENLRLATSSSPEVREIQLAGGNVKIVLSRSSKTFKAPAAIRISIRGNQEKNFKELCNTQTGDLGIQWLARTLPSAGTLRIEVMDLGSGGPTGDPPYTIDAQVFTSDRQSIRSERPLNPNARTQNSAAAACEVVKGPKRLQAKLELAHTLRVSRRAKGWQYLEYVGAGRNIYLKVLDNPNAGQAGLVNLKFFGKSSSSSGPYQKRCEETFTIAQLASGFVLASEATENRIFGTLIWRVEVSDATPLTRPDDGATLAIGIYREVDPERRGDLSTLPERMPNAYVCLPSPGRGQRQRQNTGSGLVAQAPLLRIKISAKPDVLSEAQRGQVTQYILKALAVWRGSCIHCNPEQFLFTEIDGTYFWLPQAAAIREAEGAFKADFYEMRNQRSSGEQYVPLARNHPGFVRLCSLLPETTSQGILAVQKEVGCGSRSQSISPKPKLILLLQSKRTTCGDDVNIIACAADYQLVELNLLDYSFLAFGAGSSVVGNGGRQVDLFHVLLHEVGHWLGIGHIDNGGGSVMASNITTSRCVDPAAADIVGTTAATPGGRLAFRFAPAQ